MYKVPKVHLPTFCRRVHNFKRNFLINFKVKWSCSCVQMKAEKLRNLKMSQYQFLRRWINHPLLPPPPPLSLYPLTLPYATIKPILINTMFAVLLVWINLLKSTNKSCSEWPPWLTQLKKVTRWTARTRTWGSLTCSNNWPGGEQGARTLGSATSSRWRLSRTYYFKEWK